MTDLAPIDPSVATIVQFKALDDPITDADAQAQAALMLRQRLRARGYALASDPVPGRPQPVTLNEERTGWMAYDSAMGRLDGHVIEWTATGSPVATDPDPLLDGTVTDGVYSVPVPADVTEAGGPVRVRHGLAGPVTVKVRGADDAPLGYLFTQPVTDDEEHVELVPGATRIVVARDEQP